MICEVLIWILNNQGSRSHLRDIKEKSQAGTPSGHLKLRMPVLATRVFWEVPIRSIGL